MYTVTKYPHGTFSWAELASRDHEASRQFLQTLLGWTSVDMPMGEGMAYTMYQHQGQTVAASFPISEERFPPGTPSFWNNYITVDDVDEIAPRIAELGGTVTSGPFDVFDSGRMLVLTDPQGASVSLWQARSHIGAGLVNCPGAMAWNELATPDSEGAAAFYGALFGWQYIAEGPPGYQLIQNRGRNNGGILQMTDDWKLPDGSMIPPHWSVYFSVADLDAAVATVNASGGEALHDTLIAENVGRFRIIREPAGAVFTIIQLEQPEAWTE